MSGILGGIAGNLAGGNIGRAVVSLVLDTTGYNAQLEKTAVDTEAATTQAGASTSKFSGIATAAYAVAGVAALDFAKSAIASAAEHEQVLAELTAQVGDNTQAFEDQATALQNVSGFQDEAILGADTILSRFKLTGEQVRATIPIVLDYARATGKTVPDAASAIGKALLGNTRALKAIGISYTSTGNAAQDYANIQDLITQKVGGQAAAYAQTYAGKIEILSAKFDDLKEAVGAPLLDELSRFADTINNTSTAASNAAGQQDLLGRATKDLLVNYNPLVVGLHYTEGALNTVSGWLGVTSDNTDGLTQAVGGATPALEGMTQESYDAAAAANHLSKAQQDLKDSVTSAAEGILTLSGSVKDTFNISLKEENKGFAAMLESALRFKSDMRQLEHLKIGLDDKSMVAFEKFMADQGPGYVDRFVNASAAKQRQWVNEWQKSANAVNGTIAGVGRQMSALNNQSITIHVNTAAIDAAAQKLHGLQNLENMARAGL